ncbi:hypothetical protein [Streptomyces atrovirens]|uniref:WYL domain-containing protein n=1 Tax=Streptomyces atrovirens TaxID=285556 RepID=A0ABW0DK12_9ACTN
MRHRRPVSIRHTDRGERTLHAYGFVAHAGRWYVTARTSGWARTGRPSAGCASTRSARSKSSPHQAPGFCRTPNAPTVRPARGRSRRERERERGRDRGR